MPLLGLDKVSVGYDGAPVNRDVTFDVEAGEVVALIGRNGVGKTTLAKAIIGLRPLTGGSLRFDGQEIARMDARRRARLGIGYVPQGRGIFGDLSVEDNLRMGHGIGSKPKPIDVAFGLFPILQERRHQLGGTLSGGQQQMLSIARILVGDPKLLLLDEPSDGIQPNIVEEIGALIARLNRETGLTILLIEQNIDLITSCAQRCLVMERGSITDNLSPSDLEDDDVARRTLAI